MAAETPLIGSISMVGFNFAPLGWALCNGQLLSISENSALFSLIGTTYGGDGQSTFALPDLRGRVPMHAGNGPGLTPRSLGENGGAEQVALGADQIPSHTHDPSLPVSTEEANATSPAGNVLGRQPSSRGTVPVYNGSGPTGGSMAVESNNVGGGNPHGNMPPYQAIHFVIALQGSYPQRS